VNELRRFRVLLLNAEGDAIDGHYEYVAAVLPEKGAEIDVRDGRNRSRVLRARVNHVDQGTVPPIAAVALS
jgi:hypothetical protein